MPSIRLFGLVEDSIVDGPGLRLGVFLQGCSHRCEGCHNPGSHALDGGYLEDIAVIVQKATTNPLCSGVSFSGGEPLLQIPELLLLVKALKEHGKHLLLYTGFVFEDLLKRRIEEPLLAELLTFLDVIIDGKYVKELKSMSLSFRGSRNQRMIDVKQSLSTQSAVEL